MKLYLFRHGEKASAFHHDPDLNQVGLQQAQNLSALVQTGHLPRPDHLWVSPRLRARRSFEALSLVANVPLEIHHELDEKTGYENRQQFRDRIALFLARATQKQGTLFACSHSDWLEESLPLLPSENDLAHEIHSYWSPLQYLALEYKEGLFEFIESKGIQA